MTNPIPEDFHTITPQLVVRGVSEAIAWYTSALGANELFRNTAPDGARIMHSELLLAGATVLMKVADQFWGDRCGMIADPFGHRWSIASRIEDMSPRDLHERAESWASDRKEQS
jgi:PhnB protein